MDEEKLKSGNKVPVSGQYEILDSKGNVVGERTGVKNKRLPPTPKKHQRYRLIDKTITVIKKKKK